MNAKLDLLRIFEAIQIDDHLEVRKILNKFHALKDKPSILPIKELCGLLIIAAENNAEKITKEFFNYNQIISNCDLKKYLAVANGIIDQYKKYEHRLIRSELIH